MASSSSAAASGCASAMAARRANAPLDKGRIGHDVSGNGADRSGLDPVETRS